MGNEEKTEYESKKDCRFYISESTCNGCHALNRLYCKIDPKPCHFYKKATGNETTLKDIEKEYITTEQDIEALSDKYFISKYELQTIARKEQWWRKKKAYQKKGEDK